MFYIMADACQGRVAGGRVQGLSARSIADAVRTNMEAAGAACGIQHLELVRVNAPRYNARHTGRIIQLRTI